MSPHQQPPEPPNTSAQAISKTLPDAVEVPAGASGRDCAAGDTSIVSPNGAGAREPGIECAGESGDSVADPESGDTIPRKICWLCCAPHHSVQLRKCQGCLKVGPFTN